MDLLSEHEAFLRAIFDSPEDDTPRLVYADFLDENGEPDRAAFIRVQCESARFEQARGVDREQRIEFDLLQTEIGRRLGLTSAECTRGFQTFDGVARLHADTLRKQKKLRGELVAYCPHYFGATQFVLDGGLIQQREQMSAILTLRAFTSVQFLDLCGESLDTPSGPPERPVILAAAVEAFAHHAEAERLTGLYLSNNHLLDSGVDALLRSPYLLNLKQLALYGNSISARMWQSLRERFGDALLPQPRPPQRIGGRLS